jgi:Regulator of chromosome condensation (RCC1) repeat
MKLLLAMFPLALVGGALCCTSAADNVVLAPDAATSNSGFAADAALIDGSAPIDSSQPDAVLDGQGSRVDASDAGAPIEAGAGFDAGAASGVVAVAGGFGFNCALLNNRTIKCWGSNANGELGLGDTFERGGAPNDMGGNLPVVDLGGPVAAIAVGGAPCAILANGSLKCWGWNGFGLLGQGDATSRGGLPGQMGNALRPIDLGPGRTVLKVSVGSEHACAILDNQTVKCWGYNGMGQLGIGDTTSRGNNPGQMGASLPVVDFGPGRTASSISVGSGSACALLDNSTVKCWGGNSSGQLGLGDRRARGSTSGDMGAALPTINLGTGRTAKSLAVFQNRACAILDNDELKCWGDNSDGVLGLGDVLERGGTAATIGDGLGPVDVGARVTAISGMRTSFFVGSGASCALANGGIVKCWGDNRFGNLGVGNTNSYGSSPGQMGINLPAVNVGGAVVALSQASPAANSMCAILSGGALKCWGSNTKGQLGQGDHSDRGRSSSEMGSALMAIRLW